jgi:hypothetical protein
MYTPKIIGIRKNTLKSFQLNSDKKYDLRVLVKVAINIE